MHQVLARIAVAALSVVACGNSGGSPGTSAGASGSAGHAEAGEAAGGTANGGSANLGGSAAAGDQGEGGTPEPLLQSRLALGTEFGCAIGVSGSLECWGSDEEATGQTEPPGGTYRQVRAGHQAACAIREGDFVDCWGASVVSVGTETLDAAVQFQQECLLRSSRSILCLGAAKNLAVAAGEQVGPFTRVAAGDGFGCGLREDGALHCWGSDTGGLVSDLPSGEFSDLASGPYHACAIRRGDRTIACWGAGDADDPNGSDPELIAFGQSLPPPGKFVAIAAGWGHSCGIHDDGSVECWGAGTTVDNCEETLECGQSIPPTGTFVQIACGTSNSCGIRDDGSLECWGSNTGGRSTPPAEFRAF